MEAPNITMDSPSELENTNSLLESTETPETGVLDSELQVSDKPKTQAPLLTKPFVKNVTTPKIELDGLDWLDVKDVKQKKPPVVAFKADETAKLLASDTKTFEADRLAFDKDLKQFNQMAASSVRTPELAQKEKELRDRGLQLDQKAEQLQSTSRKLEYDRFDLKKTALRNFSKKAEQGSFLGATWNSLVNGYKNTGLGNARIAIDFGIELLDKIGMPWASDEDMKKMSKDEAKKKVISEMSTAISKGYDVAKSKGTTEEYIQKKKEQGTLPRAWFGALESANVMASGGVVPRFVTGSVSAYQSINNELDNSSNPDIRNMDENSRKLISVPIALVGGAIDGITDFNVASGRFAKLLPEFTTYVLSKLPKNATIKTITEAAKHLAETPAGSAILKGAGDIGSAYAVEGAASGAQAVNDYTWKEVYDMTNDMEVFKNPKLFSKEFLGKVASDVNTGGVGGVILRSIGMGASTVMSKGGIDSMSDEAYKVWSDLAQDKDQRNLYFAKIKTDLSSGRISKQEAENRISTLTKALDLASQIPNDLPVATQKKAFSILQQNKAIEGEIKGLEDYMAGKNPNLVKSVQGQIDGLRNRINDNNNQLSKLSENAVQKQTASEVPVQPEAGVSGEMAEGKPQPETKVPTEKSQRKEVIDIEKRRKEELNNLPLVPISFDEELSDKQKEHLKKQDDINAKYDAELAALPAEDVKVEEVKPVDMPVGDWLKVQNLADRISNGDKIESSEDLQLQQNYPQVIEELLSKKTQESSVGESISGKIEDARWTNETLINLIESGTLSAEEEADISNSLRNSLGDEMLDFKLDENGQVEIFSTEKIVPQATAEVTSTFENEPVTAQPEVVSVTEETIPTEMNQEEWADVQDLADRIARGEEIVAEKDLQIQEKYPKAIDDLVAKKAKEETKPEPEPVEKTKLSEEQKVAISKGIKRGEDMVKRYPKLDDLLLKRKTLKEFQKSNQEYINADQSQKDEMTRQINYALGLAEKKSAPSVKTALGIKPTMVTVDQMASLKEQLMMESKATQKGIDFANKAKKIVNDTIKKMEKGALDARATNQLLTALDGKAETAQQRSEIISKVISIFKKSEGKIAIKEADARNEKIKVIDKAVREGQRNFKDAVKEVATIVKATLPKGKFSPSQVKVISNGLASNLLNPKIREATLAKIDRVAKNVAEATKLADMYKLRKAINKARKRDLNVEVINMVNNFADIDPKFIDNFDEYLDYAKRVYDASKAIKIVKDDEGNKVLSPRTIENFAEIDDYATKQLEKQDEILKDSLLDQYNLLVESGDINKDMSLQQIKDYVKSVQEDDTNKSDEKDKITKDFAVESFNESKEILTDQLNDDAIEEDDRDLIKAFIEMDPDVFDATEAYEAAESLMNYRENGSTSKMGKILANYIGAFNVKEISKNVGIEGRVNVGGTKRLRYKALGKVFDGAIRVLSLGKVKTNLGEGLSNAYSDNWLMYNSLLDNLGVTYFGSNWSNIKEASGLDKVIDASSYRKTIVEQFSKYMSDKYKDKKIGDSNVFTAYNMAKLDMIGRLYRETGDVKKQESYFNDRRNVMKEGIDYLMNSKDSDEKEEGQMLNDIYKELDIENAKSGKEIFDKADPVAKEIINDVIDKFKVHFPEFARVTQQQHNIILGQDNNYTADTWRILGKDSENESNSVFKSRSFKSNNIVDTEGSGRFKKVKYPSSLKKVNGKPVNIPKYDFLQNNINALSETVGDVLSIEGLNQFEGFVNSPYFKDLIKDEDARKLFKDRVAFDVSVLTNKESLPEMSKYWRPIAKGLSSIGKIGTRAGLSSLESVAAQSVPVITATAVNLRNPVYLGKAIASFSNPFDSGARDFINNSKYGIRHRGPSAQTSIDYADNLLKNGDYSTTDKALKTINKAADFWVNELLVGTDVVTAKTSWLAYYMDELAKQGENPYDIDWKTHKINDKAAKYAETMVQREQNANMPEMSGKLWSSKDPRMKVIRSFMPFSGFATKQSDKIKANMSLLFKESSLATKEDKIKAAKSLVGTIVEQSMFNLVKYAVADKITDLAYSALDKKETEEEKKLREKKAKEQYMANVYEALNGGMELLEKQGSAVINNRILDFSENLYKKLESGKDFSLIELFEEEKEKKKTFNKNISGGFVKSSSYLKKKELKKELEKPFRFYEPQDAGLFETLFETFGGTAKVLSQSVNKNAVDGLKEVYRGYFMDKNKEKIKYTNKQKDELMKNVPFYLISIFRPGAIPREINKEIQIERKLINQSAEDKNKSKKRLKELMMRD